MKNAFIDVPNVPQFHTTVLNVQQAVTKTLLNVLVLKGLLTTEKNLYANNAILNAKHVLKVNLYVLNVEEIELLNFVFVIWANLMIS